jgi:hypothetical protein
LGASDAGLLSKVRDGKALSGRRTEKESWAAVVPWIAGVIRLDWRKMTDDHYWLARVAQAALSLAQSSLFQGPLHAGPTPLHPAPPPKGLSDVHSLLVKFVACRDYANGAP